MVRSLDPRYNDFRVEQGRQRSNYAIGEMMLVNREEARQRRARVRNRWLAFQRFVREMIRSFRESLLPTTQVTYVPLGPLQPRVGVRRHRTIDGFPDIEYWSGKENYDSGNARL